jgi:hypothetical protein
MKTISQNLTAGALAVAGTVATFGLGSVAQAATISLGGGTNALQTTEINQTVTLNKFNPTLGTLTSIEISFSAESIQGFTATNTAAQAQTANITSSVAVILALPSSGIFATPNLSLSSGIQSYAVDETKSFGPTPVSDTGSVILTGAALAQFIGTGTLDVSCTSLSGITIQGGGGNLSTTQATEAACHASAIATFEPPVITDVPEPSTMLGILAVAGAGAIARRKR